MKNEHLLHQFMVPPGKRIALKKDFDPGFRIKNLTKSQAEEKLQKGVRFLAEYQDKLFAQNTYALLIIIQAMDAAGKDSTIKHVMSGLNPQGCDVTSFKAPSAEELNHDYLWRCASRIPARGRIGIFNRSYYEEVLVVRVHPELLEHQHLPAETRSGSLWKNRFSEINHFEKYLVDNGILVLKFFLHISRPEQKKRFLERIDNPEKNWKFSRDDVKERSSWDQYMRAYEDMFNHTSTPWAPWHVIPADRKWCTRLLVSEILCQKMAGLDLAYPVLGPDHKKELQDARKILMAES
jgi:PPK2 family polyphosphate:nucleotide phosphotransferase